MGQQVAGLNACICGRRVNQKRSVMPENNNNSYTSWFVMSLGKMVFAGILFIITAGILLNLLWLKHLDPSRPDPGIAILVLGIFACFGIFGVMRGGATLDTKNRQITRWWGPMIPVWRRQIAFDAIRSVIIGPGIRPGSPQAARSWNYSYHVAIQTEHETIVVRWSKSQEDVRRHGELISSAAGCSIDDRVV